MSAPAYSQTTYPTNVHRMPPTVRERRHTLKDIRRAARHDAALSLPAYRYFEDVCELSEKKGHCYAKQTHFCEVYDVEPRTVKRWEKELKRRGYLRSERSPDDGRRRVLIPSMPTEKGDISGPKGDTPRHLNRGHSEAIGDNPGSEIGDNPGQAPRVYIPPEGVEGARAHEAGRSGGSSSESQRPDHEDRHGPSLDQVKARAALAGVPEATAEEFFWHYEAQGWVTGGAHPRPIANWQAKLMQWKLRQPQFERAEDGDAAAGTGRTGPGTFDVAEREARIAAARKRREGQS